MANEPKKTTEERMVEALERQNAIQESALGVQRIQQEQAKPVNVPSHGISVFNPRGEKDYKMPLLKCDIHAPWLMKPEFHGLDREEVELFNLLQPGSYKLDLTDGSQVTAEVVGAVNKVTGKLEEMHLCGPYDPDTHQHSALFTKELKQMFPAMRVMLRQMIGDSANAVTPMREEVRRIALPTDDRKHLAVSVA